VGWPGVGRPQQPRYSQYVGRPQKPGYSQYYENAGKDRQRAATCAKYFVHDIDQSPDGWRTAATAPRTGRRPAPSPIGPAQAPSTIDRRSAELAAIGMLVSFSNSSVTVSARHTLRERHARRLALVQFRVAGFRWTPCRCPKFPHCTIFRPGDSWFRPLGFADIAIDIEAKPDVAN
jgi:hypothetical protein